MHKDKIKNIITAFIFYTTIATLFSEVASIPSYKNPFNIDLKLFYGIILINFVLLLLITKFYVSWKHILFLVLLLTHSLFCFFIYDTTMISLILKQFIGIGLVSIYYSLFFSVDHFSIEKCFRAYVYFAVAVSSIGYPLFLFEVIELASDARFQSIMLEPAHYCLLMMPALFFLLNNKKAVKYQHIFIVIILLSVVLSFSLVGYVGLLLILLFSLKFTPKRVFWGAVTIPVFIFIAYTYIEFIQLRVDDTFSMFIYQDSYALHQANLSTVAFFTNYYIAIESFLAHPFLGGGLGSHLLLYEQIIDSIYYGKNLSYLNSTGDVSLFLRILSEIGLFGIFVTFIFIFKFSKGENKNIQKAILIYFMLKLLRDGHYFPPELFFFLFIYIYNYKKRRI